MAEMHFNGSSALTDIVFNGTNLNKVYYNNTLVFEKIKEWTGKAVYVSSSTVNTSKWATISDTSIQNGISYCTFQPQGVPTGINFNVDLAYFKIDLDKYKYMDISVEGLSSDLKVGVWGYNNVGTSTSRYSVGNMPYQVQAYSISENTTNLNLQNYLIANPTYPYLAFYMPASGISATIKLHN